VLEIYIARHGQSEWNQFNRIQGQTNTRLSPQGVQQSQDLCRALGDRDLTEIFSSRLERSIQTAQPLSSQLRIPIQSTELLNELAFGGMEGKYLRDLDEEDQRVWDWWMADPIRRRIPGGESYQDLLGRIRIFLDDLSRIKGGRTILIVGHLRANQVLLGCLAGLALGDSIRIRQPNDWLYHVLPDSQIRGAEFPLPSAGEFNWQPGLLFQLLPPLL
jgi:broad specificity phosphatase PhoE